MLHVADLGPVMMTTGCGDYDSRIYVEAARRRCSKQMPAFLKRVDFDGVPITTSAVAGYCPAAIYEAAEKKGADLIVISTHGRTGLRHALVGSVAEGAVRHAGCPVLVVPSFPRHTRRAGNQICTPATQTTFGILTEIEMRPQKMRGNSQLVPSTNSFVDKDLEHENASHASAHQRQ